MNGNENLVTEQVAENVEQTTEQTPKTFTQEEVDAMIKEKLDQVLPGKIARKEAKIRKEYEQKYGDLEGVLKAGTGKESVEEVTDALKKHYASKGVQFPQNNGYSPRDIEALAKADAAEIISGGFDEVVEEVDRLSGIGIDKMTARERAVFKTLAEHRQSEERSRALTKLGVTADTYNSKEFQDFATQFNRTTPIEKVYEIFQKTQPKKNYQTMGSMQQGPVSVTKDYYTPEEIERLTEEDLDDPKVWEAVRRSMTGG